MIEFPSDLVSSFFYWYVEEDILTNGDFFYKCTFPLQKVIPLSFQSFACLLFFKNHSYTKKAYFWVTYTASFH